MLVVYVHVRLQEGVVRETTRLRVKHKLTNYLSKKSLTKETGKTERRKQISQTQNAKDKIWLVFGTRWKLF